MHRTIGYGLLAALVALSACGGPDTVIGGNGAFVESFVAEPEAIARGNTSVLSWNVSGEDSSESPMTITLEPLGIDVSYTTEYSVSPTTTSEYTLAASNEFGSDSETITLRVGVAPSITSFSATPSVAAPGDAVTLEWTVAGDGPFVFSIEPAVGTIPGTSTMVFPTTSTTYTLTASSPYGSPASREERVTVETTTASIVPSSSTCDGVAVGVGCTVTISLMNATSNYEGAQFDVSSAGFELVAASTGSATAGCLIASGAKTVAVVCESAFASGAIATVTMSRTAPSATTVVTSEAFVAVDGTDAVDVAGGSLTVEAAD